MDTAVALVQAYLHVNGYFTVTEYPVLEALRNGQQVRTVTDLDILAYRFAGAGHDVVSGGTHRPLDGMVPAVDPMLGCPADRADMIVGEVKEGAARLNPAMRDPAVLEVALTRFGCCPADEAHDLVRHLLRTGTAKTPAGHDIRIVAFGDTHEEGRRGPWRTVPMAHVVEFLQDYLRENWSVLRYAQFKDPAYGVLALIEKWGVRSAARADASGAARGGS